MQTHHVRALTGVRFFAAAWVVLYHSTRHHRDLLETHFPHLDRLTQPVLSQGIRGVDLFFVLSGFVLALNYLDQLGPRFELRTALRFWWLRLARVWPLFVVVLVVSGGLITLRDQLWGSVAVNRVDGWSFVQQVLLVQQWFGTPSWSGPAWSVSAEWLAYLLCPLLALVVLRLQHRLGSAALFAAAGVALVPLVVLAFTGGLTVPGGWALRVVCEFAAGMLICAAVSHLDLGRRARVAAEAGVVVALLALFAVFYATYDVPATGSIKTTASIVLLPAVVAGLAVGTGPLPSLLASAPAVLGGKISYALYLVHSPLLYVYRDTLLNVFDVPRRQPVTYYLEVAWLPVLLVVAWLAWRYVEEPSRRFLRGLLPPAGPTGAGEPLVVRDVPVDRDPRDERVPE